MLAHALMLFLAAQPRGDRPVPPGACPSGVVKSEDGKALAGVDVLALRGMLTLGSAVTGPDGSFRARCLGHALNQNKSTRVIFRLRDYATQMVTSDDPRDLQVVMLRPATITGRVLLADGQPAAGATIGASPGIPGWVEVGDGPQTTTDSNGGFSLVVPPGQVGVVATHCSGGVPFMQGDAHVSRESLVGSCRTVSRVATAGAGRQNQVDLRFQASTLSISGVVRDKAGKPVPGASVLAEALHQAQPDPWQPHEPTREIPNPNLTRVARADKSGAFVLGDVPAGRYKVQGYSPTGWMGAAALPVEAGATGVLVPLTVEAVSNY